MTTNRNLRLIATLLQCAILPLTGALFWMAQWSSIEVRPVHDMGATPSARAHYDKEIAPLKPHNVWGTKDLAKAGFEGCVRVRELAEDGPFPASHVVRLPADEGYRWVVMPAPEVAQRNEVFGGTPSIRDDVKIAGNCF